MRTKLAYASSALALLTVVTSAGCGGSSTSAAGDTTTPAPQPQSADAFTKQSVELPTGITMKYVETGNLDSDQVVILLHCYTDTARSFYSTAEALAAKAPNLRILIPDQRGHGETSMPMDESCAEAPEGCFRAEDFVADLLAFMEHKGLDKAHFVGHSMGSMVAQELALTHPERVQSMTLIGTTAYGGENVAIQKYIIGGMLEGLWRPALEQQRPDFQWPKDAYLLTPADADPNAEAFLNENWVVEPTADPAFLQAALPETLDIKLGAWLGVARAMSQIDNRQRLAELTVPTLILWGTQDGFFHDTDQAVLREALDGAVEACNTHYVFKTYGVQPLPASGAQESDLGHAVHWGAPEVAAADIASFIETGAPTKDLPYSDPDDVSKTLVKPGAAELMEKRPAASCN